jgi:toxin YoeB
MEIIYSEEALKDIDYWVKSRNTKIQERISALIESIEENLFAGIGKPEGFKHNLSGCWSRRINKE